MTLALLKLDLGRLPADSGADTARLRELEIERQHRAISGADKAPFFYHSWYLKHHQDGFPRPLIRGGPVKPLDPRWGGGALTERTNRPSQRMYTPRMDIDADEIASVFSHAGDSDLTIEDARDKYRQLVHQVREERQQRREFKEALKSHRENVPLEPTPPRARPAAEVPFYVRLQRGTMLPRKLPPGPRVYSDETRFEFKNLKVVRPMGNDPNAKKAD